MPSQNTPPPPTPVDRLALRVSRLPVGIQAGVLLVLIGSGIVAPQPFGAVALGLAVLMLTAMLVLSWTRLRTPERLLRIAILVLLAAVLIVRAFPA